jgi:hypothetical protein
MRDYKNIYYFLFFEQIYLFIPMERSNFAKGKNSVAKFGMYIANFGMHISNFGIYISNFGMENSPKDKKIY